MLDLLSQQLGNVLNPVRLTVPSGERVEVDGADAGLSVLVECWAHQGPHVGAAAQGAGRCLQADLGLHHDVPPAAADLVPERSAGCGALPAWRPVMGSTGIPGSRSLNLCCRPARRAPPRPAASAAPPIPVTTRSGIPIRGYTAAASCNVTSHWKRAPTSRVAPEPPARQLGY